MAFGSPRTAAATALHRSTLNPTLRPAAFRNSNPTASCLPAQVSAPRSLTVSSREIGSGAAVGTGRAGATVGAGAAVGSGAAVGTGVGVAVGVGVSVLVGTGVGVAVGVGVSVLVGSGVGVAVGAGVSVLVGSGVGVAVGVGVSVLVGSGVDVGIGVGSGVGVGPPPSTADGSCDPASFGAGVGLAMVLGPASVAAISGVGAGSLAHPATAITAREQAMAPIITLRQDGSTEVATKWVVMIAKPNASTPPPKAATRNRLMYLFASITSRVLLSVSSLRIAEDQTVYERPYPSTYCGSSRCNCHYRYCYRLYWTCWACDYGCSHSSPGTGGPSDDDRTSNIIISLSTRPVRSCTWDSPQRTFRN